MICVVNVHGLDKIMETLQIKHLLPYQYRARPLFAFNTAEILLGMASYKF
jgi:hypothetical protein